MARGSKCRKLLRCHQCRRRGQLGWGHVCNSCRSRNWREGATVPEEPEPTQEEVDKVVREQMRCLPDWWDNECVREWYRRIGKRLREEGEPEQS